MGESGLKLAVLVCLKLAWEMLCISHPQPCLMIGD